MELMPTLRVGWLNGWIPLALLYSVFGVILLIFPKDVVAALYAYDRAALSRWERAANMLRRVSGSTCLLLIIFSPLKTGSPLFIAGAVLFGVGLAGFVKALIDFRNRPLDRPAERGLYRVSRNPQEVMLFVSVCGIALMIGSWLVLFLQILAAASSHVRTSAEERTCLERYGEPYREYMDRVPRYFLFL